MAVSENSYFSNSIIGVPQVGADIDIYEVSTNPKYAVGFGFERADGNKYRYCHFGLLSPVGYVVGQDCIESSQTSTVLNCAPTGTNNVQRSGEILRPNYAGARYMELLVTASADQFAGGYITVISGSGSGYTYRIAGNTATSDNIPTTGHIYLNLYDPIVRPIGTDSDITITGCRYANLEAAISVGSGVGYCFPAGVTITGMTASNYGWVQTKGIAGVLTGSVTGSQGNLAGLSATTAGAAIAVIAGVSATNMVITPIIGYFVNPASATAFSQINLILE